MDWTSLAILIAAGWLAISTLTSLMAQHRRRLLEEWEERRALEARLRALEERNKRRRKTASSAAALPHPDAVSPK